MEVFTKQIQMSCDPGREHHNHKSKANCALCQYHKRTRTSDNANGQFQGPGVDGK